MKISLITVCHNAAKTINKTIDSVSSQSYNDIEYIIVDGVSTDGTIDILRNRNNFISKWISESDIGIYDAMNKGINLSTGEIIGTLNSDDCLFDNNVIDKIANIFTNNPEVYCLYGNLIFVNEKNKIVRRWVSNDFKNGLFEKSWTPAHPTFYCRKEIFAKFGVYKTNYKIASDVEFMFRVLEIGKVKSFYINENIVKMKIGGISTNGLRSSMIIIKEVKKAFNENGRKLNLTKYIFFKFLKIKEFLPFIKRRNILM